MRFSQQHTWAIIVVLFATCICYLPMLNNQFTNYSDDVYILKNPLIQHLSLSNLQYIFTSYFDGHYHPLTLLSLMLTYSIAGDSPFLYQLTNLSLHLLNTTLAYLFLYQLTLSSPTLSTSDNKSQIPHYLLPFIVALLFGLHTLHVESVARITERKDMLFSAFLLLSLWQYTRYVQQQQIPNYVWSLAFFLLSLLSKGQAVALAPTLWLIDSYYNRSFRSKQIWTEKIPFFALALLFGILNLFAQRYTGYVWNNVNMPFYEPFVHASYVLTHYLAKNLLPIQLSVFYPYPNAIGEPIPPTMWLYTGIWLLLALFIYRIKYHKLLFFGIIFYLIHIILMIRLLPIADNIMPDRYNYVPSIGLFIMLSWIVQRFYSTNKIKIIYAFLVIYCLLLGALTFWRTQIWHDGKSVWNDALQQYPHVAQLWQNLGDAYLHQQDLSNGVAALQKAIELDPQNMLAYISLSSAMVANGQTNIAQQYLQKACQIPVQGVNNLANRATIFSLLSQRQQAMRDLQIALQQNPYQAKLYFNLALLHLQQGNYTQAQQYLQHVFQLRPMFIIDALLTQGTLSLKQNDLITAQKNAEKCLQLQPNNAKAAQQLAEIHYKIGNFSLSYHFMQQAKQNGATFVRQLEQAILQKNNRN
ncbi:MAG: tetratricopeptide repeat protein [Chitinophagales bacterium]|nr:tetratricopeptide repeat protein [Chitinophagales bacterium]